LWECHRSVPPAGAVWGRFLVAMGEVAAERLGDDAAAARWFRRCLDAEPVHRDVEACVAAGHGQGVLWERAGDLIRAIPAYRAAAAEGFRCASVTPPTLRAAVAAIRVGFQRAETLTDADASLAKQSWLGWTWLHLHEPGAIDDALAQELGRQLCSFLLPEDDPTRLAACWRDWPPHVLGGWRDTDAACLLALFQLAATAADQHLADEGGGESYRLLAAAASG